jgi:hypothetical protein
VESCRALKAGADRAKRNVQNAVAWRVSRTFFARFCDGMSRRNVSLVLCARVLAFRWIWCASVGARSVARAERFGVWERMILEELSYIYPRVMFCY